jgi:formylglycine-generating enzyme required for sulfatase activity
MMRKGSVAIVLVLSIIGLTACAKKEETASTAESTPAKPAYTPGEMVLIPAGEFIFGITDKETTAYPQQKVNLPAFWIDKYEVTNSEFLDFCIKANYASEGNFRLFVSPDKGKNPVVNVTWNDAEAYCKGTGKRLPTEQEWEKAARGTDGRRYPWGEKWDPARSNAYEASLRGPTEVGRYDDVSPYGVHDMLGNAQEWTSTWYKAYKGNSKRDENFGERFRVLRGARWDMYGSKYHLWVRSAALPKALYAYGFRCAKDATPEEAAKAGKAN